MIDSARARMVGSSSATSTAGVGDFFVCVFAMHTLLTDQTKRARGSSVSIGNPARPDSQHAVTEKDMIQRQHDDRADCGDAGAVNGADVETSRPATAKNCEHPTADDRTHHAEQNIDNGPLACGADRLACGQPEHEPQQTPYDHRHRAPIKRWFPLITTAAPTAPTPTQTGALPTATTPHE